MIGLASPEVEKGVMTPIGIVAAATSKLRRVARGSLGAEIQGLTNLEEELVMVRAGWYEYRKGKLDHERAVECLKELRGVCVLDAKSLVAMLKNRTPPTN